ncbi:MAG: polysaccharide pyruvyl transferase family protein [Myxococcales bacterium]|nr:polysaccharide pyruvyl transferase family protein [Myxococcales bacterium]MCB9708175.1 polysaccharide pyruvyl transferase family protein [Myxococcales bacterium]
MRETLKGAAGAAVHAGRLAFDAVDADRMLQRSMVAMIELARTRQRMWPASVWAPGEQLKLLFVGYNGTRNTGADVRVEEMIRQFRHVLGDDYLSTSVATVDPACSQGYFPTSKQLHMPKVFPKFLFDHVHLNHGVVIAEGSMFKSLFANALSTLMVGALGLARAERKLGIAYGGEAGAMDRSLRKLVAHYARDALILVRNAQSRDVLSKLDVVAEVGTDTAWTFEPRPHQDVRKLLTRSGWDGQSPILAVCPINGFWWPVKPSLSKAVLHGVTGAYRQDHYASLYFHKGGREVRAKQRSYLEAMATAIARIAHEQRAFVCIVGMERLDRGACEDLAACLGRHVPLFISDEWDMHELVAILRQATWLISSRYHAIVTTMPAGVLSLGVTMDERIVNLMADRDQDAFALDIEQPQLSENIYDAFCAMQARPDSVRDGILRSVARNIRRMGSMGQVLARHVQERLPKFPLREELRASADPLKFLPPLSSALGHLMEEYGEQA